jgi:hypothetical protein
MVVYGDGTAQLASSAQRERSSITSPAKAADSEWATSAILAVVALLGLLTYLPALFQPFISDDYLQIAVARKYGAFENWPALAADPLYRCRAVSLVITYWSEMLGGISPAFLYSTAIAFHIVNSWLVFFLGRTFGLGQAISAAAAVFFAAYEGHQEAVMWYGAFHELTLFFFCLLFLIAWKKFVDSEFRNWPLFAGALVCFVLGLLSKEPAVMLVPLALLMSLSWRNFAAITPLAAIAGAYTIAIFAAKSHHLHLNDGTFSLSAPFYFTWTNSMGRLFWFWGAVSLIAMAMWGTWREHRRTIALAAVYTGLTLLPFSFLAYMTRIPSRHTYLASAGLAFIVAAGFMSFRMKSSHIVWSARVLAIVILAHQVGYVWTKKRGQFLERAKPTESLLQLARDNESAFDVPCFPYGEEVAFEALRIVLNREARFISSERTPTGICRALKVLPAGTSPTASVAGH